MQLSLKVEKRRPRDRSRPEGLIGYLAVTLRSCSKKLGDPFDSYLHVGTGAFSISIDRSLLTRLAEIPCGRFEEQVQRLGGVISLDYEQFSATRAGPVVPGSSVKGNVRSRLELSFVPKEDTVKACFIRASPPRPTPRLGQHGWRHYRIWERALQGNRGAPCSHTEGWERCEVCILCDLFGTAGLSGLISFSDFVGSETSIAKLNLLTGEKLEAAVPGSKFRGEVFFMNLEPVELGLLFFGMGLRDSRVGKPVLLGKLKYRRDLPYIFGVVRYEVEVLKLARLSKPLKVDGTEMAPGSTLEGGQLDRLVGELVKLTQREFGGELVDVDEVEVINQLAG